MKLLKSAANQLRVRADETAPFQSSRLLVALVENSAAAIKMPMSLVSTATQRRQTIALGRIENESNWDG